MAHAKLSPSAAVRWMTCPGSVHVIDARGIVSKGGAAANKGTAIHTMCELALTKSFDCNQYVDTTLEGVKIDEEMAALGQVYVDYIKAAAGDKYFEQKVSVEHILDNCWGTADCVICNNDHLIVIDLKTGRKHVEVTDNKQLLIYALGAHKKYDWIYGFNKVTMVISQPPLDYLGTWTIDVNELLAFGDDLLAAKKRIDTEPDTFVMTEKGCEWCPAKFVCPEHIAIANEAAAKEFANDKAIDVDDLAYWLEKLPALKNFILSIEDQAYTRLVSGSTINNYKLGTPSKRRNWGDEKALLKFVNQTGLQSAFLKEVLISPAQADKLKLDPKLQDQLNLFVEYTEAKAPVVRQKSSSAADDFK